MTASRPRTAVRLGVAAAFDGVRLLPGDVSVVDGRVEELGLEPAAGDLIAAPGFVDLQVNGHAGVDFLAADVEAHRRAARALTAVGVTAYQPTLVTASPDTTERAVAVAAAADAPDGARVLPVHLEGPFLSPAWPGAHAREHLRLPDSALVERLRAAGPVGYVTLAPELPGGLELTRQLVDDGVVVAVGHSDATAEQAAAAFDVGATALTHVFNAHRRFAGRDPGPAGAALARGDVWITVIADGLHVARHAVGLVLRAAGTRVVAISDAMLAAGLGDGDYVFGSAEVHVEDGRATLAGGRLAGSAAPLDQCVRQLVAWGVAREEALAAVTSRPADAIGRGDLGRLCPGCAADVVVLDAELRPVRTLRDGRVVFER